QGASDGAPQSLRADKVRPVGSVGRPRRRVGGSLRIDGFKTGPASTGPAGRQRPRLGVVEQDGFDHRLPQPSPLAVGQRFGLDVGPDRTEGRPGTSSAPPEVFLHVRHQTAEVAMVASDFFNRLTAYPVVASAYGQAAAGLAWAKDRSAYAKSAADLAESGLRRAAQTASPLLSRYEERAAGLDRLACRQLLDRLETACPTVLEPTDEVMKRGRDYYSAAVKPKVDLLLSPVTAAAATAESVKSSTLEGYRRAVASRLGQSGLRRFDRLIELLGDGVDRYLPPGPDEKTAKKSQEESPAETSNGNAKNVEREDDDNKAEKKSGDGESEAAELADPAHSLAMAYELGHRLGARATERLAEAGSHLVGRLTGRSIKSSASEASENGKAGTAGDSEESSPSSSSSSNTAQNSSNRRSSKREGVDEVDEEDREDLDRTDMSTD
uniref:Perilipin n=3 Tax=Macrostomum lignano TaxID=282301 RepID=A0A1I8G1B2_9PLAT